MRRWTAMWALLALVGLSCSAGADDRVWRKVSIEMSDGTKIVGELCIPEDKFVINNEQLQRDYPIPLAMLKRFDILVEKEYQDMKWIFREAGRDEKVYLAEADPTGDKYPIRWFRHRATFADGKTMEGQAQGRTLFIKDQDGQVSRQAVLQKMEGKVGQKLDDMVYVKTIVFLDQASSALGTIKGTIYLPDDEVLHGVVMLNRKEDLSFKAEPKPGNQFFCDQCITGVYDLMVVTDKCIYTYFSNEKDEGCARIHQGVVRDIMEWKANIKSLFEIEEPVYGAGNPKDCFILACLERRGELAWSDPAKWAWVQMLRRYEIWHMVKAYDTWEITTRHFVFRRLAPSKDDPRQTVVVVPKLGGLVLTPENPTLDIALKLGPNKEPPVLPEPEVIQTEEPEEDEDDGE